MRKLFSTEQSKKTDLEAKRIKNLKIVSYCMFLRNYMLTAADANNVFTRKEAYWIVKAMFIEALKFISMESSAILSQIETTYSL